MLHGKNSKNPVFEHYDNATIEIGTCPDDVDILDVETVDKFIEVTVG